MLARIKAMFTVDAARINIIGYADGGRRATAGASGVRFYSIHGGGHPWPGSMTAARNPLPKTRPVSLDRPARTIIGQTAPPFSASALFHHGE